MRTIEAVLFDLDGTFLDTADDLIQALYSLPESATAAPVSPRELRAAVSHGCRGLLQTGLNIHHDDPRYLNLCEQILNYYTIHLLDNTKLFPGIAEVLIQLDQVNTPWGIVTNKPERFTHALLKGLELPSQPACVISGDTLPNRKPHPAPLLHACQLINKSPANCLYVGDAQTDIIASNAAKLHSLVALYGYISEYEDPNTWAASGVINHPSEIINWLQN